MIQLGPKPHWFIEGERMQFIQGEIRGMFADQQDQVESSTVL